MKIRSIIFLLVFFAFSCNSQKATSTTEKTASYFDIGEGGGFSGLYTQYRVYSSGLVETYNFKEQAYQSWKQIDKNKTVRFFNEIEELKLIEEEIDMPGNMSEYFILYSNDKGPHKLVWPSGGNQVNPKIYSLYKEIFNLCNKEIEEPIEE